MLAYVPLEGDSKFVRGDVAPTVYHLPGRHVTVTHHVDDGRITGPIDDVKHLLDYLAHKMLLKASDILEPGRAVEHLGDL